MNNQDCIWDSLDSSVKRNDSSASKWWQNGLLQWLSAFREMALGLGRGAGSKGARCLEKAQVTLG